MSYTVQMLAKQTMREFLEKYPQEEFPTGADLLVMIKNWITQSGHSAHKKMKLASTMMSILREQYLVDEHTSREFAKRFKIHSTSNWSEKALSNQDLVELYSKIDANTKSFSDLRSAMALTFMLLTGARLQAALHAKDYNLTKTHLTVTIPRQKSRVIEDIPKSIPLDATLPNGKMVRDMVQRYMKEKQRMCSPSVYLFTGRGAESLSAESIRAYIRKLALSFHLSPHKLRHTAGTLVAQRVGVLEATRLLDHSSLAITQKYIAKYAGDSSETISQVWSVSPATHSPEITHVPSTKARLAIDRIKALHTKHS
jgi:integrase